MNDKRLSHVIGPLLTMFCTAALFSLINTILPAMQEEFSSTLTQLQWVMNIMGIFLCSTLVIFGRIADKYGRNKLFIIASILMIVSFVGIGFSTNIYTIFVCQALTGLAASVFLLSTQSIMLQYYTAEATGKGMAIWAGVVAIGLGLGPVIGGAIATFIGWRTAFFVLAAFVFLGMVLTILRVAEMKSQRQTKLDILGAFLLWLVVASFILDLVEGQFVPAWLAIIVGVIFALSLIGLIIHERRVANPILLFDLLKNASFLKGSLANGLTIFYVWAAFFLFPYYLQSMLHTTEFMAGVFMLFVSVPLATMSFFIGKWYLKFGAKKLLAIGFSLTAIAALIQTQMTPQMPVYFFLIACVLFGFGWGFTWSVSMTTAMSNLPEGEVAASAGTFLTFQEVGGSLGLAVVVAVVRLHKSFVPGYQGAMWVLVAASLIALGLALSIRAKA